MHEFTVAQNLLNFLKEFSKREKIDKIVRINLSINPYSCLDEEILNFIFSSLSKGLPKIEKAEIKIKRRQNPGEREIIIENLEVEVSNGD